MKYEGNKNKSAVICHTTRRGGNLRPIKMFFEEKSC